MKDLLKKYGSKHAAAFLLSAIFAVLSFYCYISFVNSPTVSNTRQTYDKEELPLPLNHCRFKKNFFRSVLPSVNSSRSERSSNPVAGKASGALFNRIYTDFYVIFSACKNDRCIFVFQKYIKESIPVRAGPFLS